MKTKSIFLKQVIINIVMMLILTTAIHATVQNKYLDNTGATQYVYFNGIPLGDTLVIHAPSSAISGLEWTTPTFTSISNQDSIIITTSNTGQWGFYSDQTPSKTVYIYRLYSPPTASPSMADTDTNFCTVTINLPLDAGNQNPGGHAATYLWSTGATTRIITIHQLGTYTVTITNACGIATFTKIVTQNNSNAPHLGTDKTFCWGSTYSLDPLSTNVSSYQWSTGETTPTISIDTTGSYWVFLVDNNGCNGRDTIQITTLVPTSEPICYVEFDTLTLKNNINWTANLPSNADSVNIYKETSLGVWTLIGTVHKSVDHFVDNGSVPNAQSYSYKIAVIDTCGNESVLSSYHTTITLLSTYDSGTDTYGFSWSPYYGLTVSDYYLYGINANGVATLIGTVPGNQFMFNYVNPSTLFHRYFVAFQTPSCSSKTNVLVKSNWVQSVLTGINELTNQTLKVYPNPAQDIVRIDGAFIGTLRLLDITGRLVLEQVNKDGYINISTLAKGCYILELRSDKGIVKTKLFKE